MQGFEPSAAGPGSGARVPRMEWHVELLIALIAVLVIGLIVAAVVRTFVSVTTIHDYERGLRYQGGRLVGLAGTGAHVTIRPFSEMRLLDVRPAIVPVDGQEILTADGVTAKISLSARYVVGDAVAAVTRDADFRRTLYLLLQLALRDAVAGRSIEEVLAARRELGPEVREACAARLAELGVELLEVEVRDVMLPAELRRAYAGVVAARKEGQVSLERARAETAALRSLANTGHMLDENPGLLQLRILQQLGDSSGSTVVYGVPEPGAGPKRRAMPEPGAVSDRGAVAERGAVPKVAPAVGSSRRRGSRIGEEDAPA